MLNRSRHALRVGRDREFTFLHRACVVRVLMAAGIELRRECSTDII